MPATTGEHGRNGEFRSGDMRCGEIAWLPKPDAHIRLPKTCQMKAIRGGDRSRDVREPVVSTNQVPFRVRIVRVKRSAAAVTV